MESSCLDDRTLAAWADGTLSATARALALAHVAGCSSCQELVAAMMQASSSSTGGERGEAPGGEADLGWAPGTRLGRYTVDGVVASGGMGVVLLATDPTLQRKVALKVRRPAGGARAAQLEARLLQEARALAQVRHPNVVSVYDAGISDGYVFVVMELVEGASLREWIDRRPGWRASLPLCLAAGRGLQALHQAGLAHRDLKPDNVLLAHDGRVLVADLGLVADHREPDAPRLTVHGAVVGTPRYMAPEQLAGARGDARSDQFGFAALTREVLSAGGEPLPPRLRRVLAQAMDPEPAYRYPSMKEVLAALAASARTGRRQLAAGVLALGAGALAAVGLATRGLAPSEPPDRAASRARAAAAAPSMRQLGGPGPSIAAPMGPAPDPVERVLPAADAPATGPKEAAPASSTALPPSPVASRGRPLPGAAPAAPPLATARAAPERVAAAPAVAAPDGSRPSPLTPRQVEYLEAKRRELGLQVYPMEQDASRFRPSEYLGTARALARGQLEDAELVGLSFAPVARDGSIDLLRDVTVIRCAPIVCQSSVSYFFRSPSRSRPVSGQPASSDPVTRCSLIIGIWDHQITVQTIEAGRCSDPVGPPPRCSLPQVWAAAERRGADPELLARIQWRPGQGWQFSTNLEADPRSDASALAIPDDC